MKPKTSRRVLNYSIFALIAAGLIAIVLPHRDLWVQWIGGETIDSQPLFDAWSVTTWGRLGKGLQFLAGLVAIIDLLNLEELRKVGKKANERLQERLQRRAGRLRGYRLSEIRKLLYKHLVAEKITRGYDTDHSTYFLDPKPPASLDPDSPVGLDDYLKFRELLIDRFGTGLENSLSESQCSTINDELDALLESHLSPEDGIAYRKAEKGLTVWALTAVLLVIIAGIAMLLTESMTIWIVYVSIFCVLIFMAVSPKGVYVTALPLFTREAPALFIGYLATHLLHRTRPLLLFRKIALVLFVVGFTLDLLAS
ncbi:hypothetical protein AB0K48_55045 [Nonomuraea sp. NPDC055795]